MASAVTLDKLETYRAASSLISTLPRPNVTHEPHRGSCGRRRLTPIAERLGDELACGHDVCGCFNNDDDDGFAVADARTLRDALA